MKFLPFDNYTFQSPLAPDQVAGKISEITEPKRFFFPFIIREKPFHGQVGQDSFEISRYLKYRNSYNPVIYGKVQASVGGSMIGIKMHPSPAMLISIAIGETVLGMFFFSALVTTLSGITQYPKEMLYIAGGGFIFAYLEMMIAYKIEARKSKQAMLESLQAHEVPDAD